MITCVIREVDQAEYEACAIEFMGLMETFNQQTDGEYFTRRAEDGANIANEYRTPGHKYVAHAMRGAQVYGLVGLMILSEHDAYLKVEDLCTHPLTSGVGVLLVQHAVDESVRLGRGGTLRLYDASGGTFYDDLGFTVIDGNLKQLVGGIQYR